MLIWAIQRYGIFVWIHRRASALAVNVVCQGQTNHKLPRNFHFNNNPTLNSTMKFRLTISECRLNMTNTNKNITTNKTKWNEKKNVLRNYGTNKTKMICDYLNLYFSRLTFNYQYCRLQLISIWNAEIDTRQYVDVWLSKLIQYL